MTAKYRATIPGTENVLIAESYDPQTRTVYIVGFREPTRVPLPWVVEKIAPPIPENPGTILRNKAAGSLYVRGSDGQWRSLNGYSYGSGYDQFFQDNRASYEVVFEGIVDKPVSKKKFRVNYLGGPLFVGSARSDGIFDTRREAETFIAARVESWGRAQERYSIEEIDAEVS